MTEKSSLAGHQTRRAGDRGRPSSGCAFPPGNTGGTPWRVGASMSPLFRAPQGRWSYDARGLRVLTGYNTLGRAAIDPRRAGGVMLSAHRSW